MENPATPAPIPFTVDFAKNLRLIRVLLNDTDKKQLTILCHVLNDPLDPNHENQAIAILSKPEFDPSFFTAFLGTDCSLPMTATHYFNNTCYNKFWLQFEGHELSKVQCNFIYPCTPDHIKKYGAEHRHIVEETYQLYETVTKPLVIQAVD